MKSRGECKIPVTDGVCFCRAPILPQARLAWLLQILMRIPLTSSTMAAILVFCSLQNHQTWISDQLWETSNKYLLSIGSALLAILLCALHSPDLGKHLSPFETYASVFKTLV